MTRALTLAAALVVSSSIATSLATAAGPSAAQPTRTAPPGSPAATSTSVRPISIADFRRLLEARRGRVLVLNLWASWCAPCLKEIPELLKLEKRFANCGVQVFGLATDDPVEADRAVAAMHAKYFPAFESYARTEGEPDSYASVVDPAWNELMPTTYVIDAAGKTVRRLQGGKSLDEFARVVQEVAPCATAAATH